MIPQLLKKPVKKSQKGNEEVGWDFDSKEHAREKYGNFNTPILIKLTSKYNKLALKTAQETDQAFEKVDA